MKKKGKILKVIIIVFSLIFIWDVLIYPPAPLISEIKEFDVNSGSVRNSFKVVGLLLFRKEEPTVLAEWLADDVASGTCRRGDWRIIYRKGVLSGYSPQYTFSNVGESLERLKNDSPKELLSRSDKSIYARRILEHWKASGRPEIASQFPAEFHKTLQPR